MPQSSIDLVRNAYDLFRQKDIPAIFQAFDAQVEFYQSSQVPWGGHYQGHAQVRLFFEKLTQAIDSVVEPVQFIDAGEDLLVVVRVRGTARSTGKTFDVPGVHRGSIRNGKVIRFEVYIDNPSMLRALQPAGGQENV